MKELAHTTTIMSDAVTALGFAVDTYNDGEALGAEIGATMLHHISDGVEALQQINPVYFTVEEIEWINTLTTQLNEIDSINLEGESQ